MSSARFGGRNKTKEVDRFPRFQGLKCMCLGCLPRPFDLHEVQDFLHHLVEPRSLKSYAFVSEFVD